MKTLSDEITNLFEIEYLDSMADVQGDVNNILKQFIKDLKEELNFMVEEGAFIGTKDTLKLPRYIRELIDKLAGNKLIEEKQ